MQIISDYAVQIANMIQYELEKDTSKQLSLSPGHGRHTPTTCLAVPAPRRLITGAATAAAAKAQPVATPQLLVAGAGEAPVGAQGSCAALEETAEVRSLRW